MINKVKNDGTISGKIFGFGRFGLKEVVKDNEKRIQGSLIVATDKDETNLVEIHFIPQSPTYKSGKPNRNYDVLKQIINEEKTIEKVGSKDAMSISATGSLSNNVFFMQDNSSNELVLRETPQVRGNFIHIRKEDPYCGFNVDCLYKGIEEIYNDEGELKKAMVKVEVYDTYRKFFMPFTLELEDKNGIDYIKDTYEENQSYATISVTSEDKTIQPSAENGNGFGFGVKAVESQPRRSRRLLIIGADAPRELPMTEEEMEEARQSRATFLSEEKNRSINRQKKDNKGPVGFGSSNVATSAAKVKEEYIF